ncbi:hypothetical protein IE53DRAFT_361285 [Violaceomyces palustris]|uniref:Uncharacterized protein n=1 Tax=Violaceomyces palustris TaxID=1673888 RepID=A0ACD0P148_9BASI|nr:hypothetical protein IE53DRAFT_361285 [Violaceomyces palustris]
MHDNHPKIIDKENNAEFCLRVSLHGEQAPGYDEALDSASGAAIKADRNPTDPKQLENETADFVRMKHGQQTDGSQEPEPSAPTPSEESVRADKFSNNPKTLQEETVKKQRLHH